MNDSPTPPAAKARHHNGWLILIAAFKVAQALLFVAIGVGAIHLLHKDVEDVLTEFARHLRFNPESRFIDFLIDHAAILNDGLLKRIGEATFIYAGLDLLEGIGLYLEKIWAEFLTLAITASLLPWEAYELFRKFTPIRISLLTINLLVFLYLLKLVVERRQTRKI
jgi:uncharacterized membrane protein (DUF2068 family)